MIEPMLDSTTATPVRRPAPSATPSATHSATHSATQPNEHLTPTIRRALRRSLLWVACVVFLIVIALVTLTLGKSSASGTEFAAANAGPSGSAALARVLADRGVVVTDAASFTSARRSLISVHPTTLFLIDSHGYLSKSRLEKLSALATNTVLLSPNYDQLRWLVPSVRQAGFVPAKPLKADCSLPAAVKARSVSGAGEGYRVIGIGEGTITCFASDKISTGSGTGSTYSVVQLHNGPRSLTIVGTSAAFTNEYILKEGNASLALNLLGAHPHLTWYLPTIADAEAAGERSIAALTPTWVSSVLLLSLLTAGVAAFWRGRRFGPLVVENLPVIVRSNETMQGRARLYQRSGARLRALDALRIGALSRLAFQCGLPTLATVDEVILAVAQATASDPRSVRTLLVEAVPRSDRALVRLSDELAQLERNVGRDIRPH